jgi:hypothetical protein
VIPNPDVPSYFKPSHIERIASLYRESAHEAAMMAESQFRKDVKDAGVETKLQLAEGDEAVVTKEARKGGASSPAAT